jgi:voltage-gated potassium channel
MTEERWFQITYWPLLIASILFIIAYSWQVIFDLTGTAETIARSFIYATWFVFITDYLVRLWLSSPRRVWFRHHIFDLLVVIIPPLKPLRLLQAFTRVASKRTSQGTALRSRISVYGAGAALILIWVAALAMLDAERGKPGANIETFGDAIWWAFVTITTVGYGDYYPVTPQGRVVAVALMIGGVAVVGVVTATFASWVLERAAARTSDDDEPATRGQIRAISKELTQITNRVSGGPSTPPEQ